MAAAPCHDGLEGGGSIDYPWWAPTFWHGMGLQAWIGLLQEGHFRVSPSRLGVAASITLLSGFNSLGRLATDLKYSRKLHNSTLPRDPIFIIGHWRSGTTLLHELMMLDPQFSAPSTYQCFAPGHFLTTRGFTRRAYAQALLPSRRPGDNVKAGWNRPQEDEFALMNLGAPSPYRRIAFPHTMPAVPQALDLTGLSPREQQRWHQSCRDFILRLQVKDRRRLVLKSPTHTARVGMLLALFPDARFIHIVRDPFTVFPSTKRLWQSLHKTQSLQKQLPENLDDYIFRCFREMHEALQRDRQLLASNQLHELRYEDLIQDPLATLSAAYARLNLGDVEPMAHALAAHLPDINRYQVNSYRISTQLKGEIARECADFFRTYHYCPETGAALPIPAG